MFQDYNGTTWLSKLTNNHYYLRHKNKLNDIFSNPSKMLYREIENILIMLELFKLSLDLKSQKSVQTCHGQNQFIQLNVPCHR